MTALPPAPPTFAQHLLREGIPLTLLLDLHDPEGLKVALAAELLASDVATAPAPPVRKRRLRSA